MIHLEFTGRCTAAFDPLFERNAFPEDIAASVNEILCDIRKRGDEAICHYAKKFDGVDLSAGEFHVSQEELDAADDKVDQDIKDAIDLAAANIIDFSSQKLPKAWNYSPREGVQLGEKYAPLSRIACYVPGGTAPLVSTVLHTAAIAKAAGVPEIVITTPPQKDGSVNPAILYAAKKAGATEVLKLGGVYAIGALAYGTESIKRARKICGPGNAYVTAAKRQVYGYCSLDLVAGPSEVMVIADKTAPAKFIAADLLSQAEHGSGFEQAVMVSDCAELILEVEKEVLIQKELLSRSECVDKVLDNGIFFIKVNDMQAAAEVADLYAPEHLEIICENAEDIANLITNAGAIFLGPWTPEPVGDFVAGPSHVLPTGGAGHHFSGLTVDQFFRRTSLIKYSKEALQREVGAVAAFAKAEGLDAHGRSGTIRFE
ncbi:histidinol dehydrogenase [Lentisphaera profundi]|uniref:Histidinol dehydrogenase n=1 Tax=Lentisphaera profundi TaxID=1658616 RepID=A0ABY7VYV1_9BACT|nr:histidinol dehydrogenase [Lentisphaera profundi]WDE97228.1 histidinol dehydrogenase [Lentisphaera profundi]